MYKHLFFDLDQTIAPSRQPILPEMYEMLETMPYDKVVVSGQTTELIGWQSNQLPAFRLGQNGNHAIDPKQKELWYTPLSPEHRQEILDHIQKLIALLPETPNPEWTPVEDRGGQITFSPIGNTAPVEHKKNYDPDRKKREKMLKEIPFVSEELVVKIGGSTSLDYIHKDRHKGGNVKRLIETLGWKPKDCVYFGDGLYPGGNDELVIGVIDTIAVKDHIDAFNKISSLLKQNS